MTISLATVKLYTYCTSETDRIFEIPKAWLQNKINVPVDQFLSEYTFDDAEDLYYQAKQEDVLLSEKEIESEV